MTSRCDDEARAAGQFGGDPADGVDGPVDRRGALTRVALDHARRRSRARSSAAGRSSASRCRIVSDHCREFAPMTACRSSIVQARPCSAANCSPDLVPPDLRVDDDPVEIEDHAIDRAPAPTRSRSGRGSATRRSCAWARPPSAFVAFAFDAAGVVARAGGAVRATRPLDHRRQRSAVDGGDDAEGERRDAVRLERRPRAAPAPRSGSSAAGGRPGSRPPARRSRRNSSG